MLFRVALVANCCLGCWDRTAYCTHSIYKIPNWEAIKWSLPDYNFHTTHIIRAIQVSEEKIVTDATGFSSALQVIFFNMTCNIRCLNIKLVCCKGNWDWPFKKGGYYWTPRALTHLKNKQTNIQTNKITFFLLKKSSAKVQQIIFDKKLTASKQNKVLGRRVVVTVRPYHSIKLLNIKHCGDVGVSCGLQGEEMLYFPRLLSQEIL